jgi:uncharacterized protein (TIGR02145 family)
MEKKYKEAKIGNQIWMAENLNVSKFRNGDVIPEAKTNEEWIRAGKEKQPAWCYYNNDKNNDALHGKLYNAYAVDDPRGLAPSGWHIPNDKEWSIFEDNLLNMAGFDGKSKYWVALKVKSQLYWHNKTGGNNKSGFTAYPSGSRFFTKLPQGKSYKIGDFYELGDVTVYWSNSQCTDCFNGDNNANYTRWLTSQMVDQSANDQRYIFRTAFEKGMGASVRCIKDLNGTIITYEDGIKIEANYAENRLNGDYKEWYPNGNIKTRGNYLNDKDEGDFHLFDSLGRETAVLHYAEGKLQGKSKVFFDSNGKPVTNFDYSDYYREMYYLNEVIDTNYLVTYYYLNGIKKYETKLLSDAPEIPNGMTKFYDTFGNLSSEGLFISGKKVGIWKEYHPNGMPKKQYFMITEYKLYKTENQRTYSEIIKANVINGYVFYYDETGTILKSEYFRHGDIEKEFDHDKSIKLEKKYKDDPNQSRLSLF